jgi:hypothetical protein
MLTYVPAERITAKEALGDPWILENYKRKDVSKTLAQESLKNLRKFKVFVLFFK